jgi:hypothetical protein
VPARAPRAAPAPESAETCEPDLGDELELRLTVRRDDVPPHDLKPVLLAGPSAWGQSAYRTIHGGRGRCKETSRWPAPRSASSNGNIGRAFATRPAVAGHNSPSRPRTPPMPRRPRPRPARTRAVRPDGIARDTDLLILAVPYAAADALRGAGDVAGKTILDITNPVTPDYSALASASRRLPPRRSRRPFPRGTS